MKLGNNIMAITRIQKKIDWTPEDRRRHQAIRDQFKDKPTIEELVAKGELSGHPVPLSTYLNLRLGFPVMLRSMRAFGLTGMEAKSPSLRPFSARIQPHNPAAYAARLADRHYFPAFAFFNAAVASASLGMTRSAASNWITASGK